jgi:hypothetical protein
MLEITLSIPDKCITAEKAKQMAEFAIEHDGKLSQLAEGILYGIFATIEELAKHGEFSLEDDILRYPRVEDMCSGELYNPHGHNFMRAIIAQLTSHGFSVTQKGSLSFEITVRWDGE